ncbi:MAG: flagellar export protein FliJ [Bacillota bacterium]|nr:flagellar export protein FliJ [Bacillota bacterium]
MPKFEFRLQSVLNIKKQMEESLKNEYGKAVKRLEREKEKLKHIEIEQEECMKKMSSDSSKGVKVLKLKEYSVYISRLKEKAQLQKENINMAQKNADNYRERLVKAMQEREILEKLKEKKYQEYLVSRLKAEEKLSEEIAGYNYTNEK